MNKKLLSVVMLVSCLLLTACDTSKIAPTSGVKAREEAEANAVSQEVNSEEAENTQEEAPEADNTESVQESSEPAQTTETEEVFYSGFTGEEIGYMHYDHRPLAVMLNNIKEGCPQSGIEQASMVFECPVEGRITRLMGIFEEYENIEKIGSVRSSRDYFVYLAMEVDAIYAHFGQATVYVGDLLNSNAVDNISGAVSGIENPANHTFYRSDDRSAPHNVYIDNEGLKEDIANFGYRTTLRTGFTPKFIYPEPGSRATHDEGEDVTVIYPGGKNPSAKNGFAQVQARFEYNKDDQKYYRFQYGDKHIDKETGNQLKYDNVVLQYCDGMVRDSHDYLAFGLVGDNENKCQIFTNGKMVEGTWKRTELFEPAKYYDKDGNEIEVNRGKTWICIIWNDYAEDVVCE